MKPNLYVFFIVLSLSACQKDKYEIPIFEPGPMTYGWAEAKKGNRDWLASAGAYWTGIEPNRFVALGIGTETEEGFIRENLIFGGLLFKESYYPVVSTLENSSNYVARVSYGIFDDDGDVLGDYYELDESKYNWISITAVDSLNNKISGSFQVSFKIATPGGKNNPRNPDKVTFSDGAFEVEIFR
ncbi:MAG TPA: hypothetical protein PKA00_15925 [Saprospiraceae bacterium]|nr:hypothetical protein [Saprospiraceae bacterium]HMQ84403.1 hypothetical protein [Saprospiraceae bacterium]